MRQRRSPQERQAQVARQRQQQGLLRALLRGDFEQAQGHVDRGAQLYTQPALRSLVQHPNRLACLAWLAPRAYHGRALLTYAVLQEACLEVARQANPELTDAWWAYVQRHRPAPDGTFISHELHMEPTLQALTRMADPLAYPKAAQAIGFALNDPVSPLIRDALSPDLPARLQTWARLGVRLGPHSYTPGGILPHATLSALYFRHAECSEAVFHETLLALEQMGVDLRLADQYRGVFPAYDAKLASFERPRQRAHELATRPLPRLLVLAGARKREGCALRGIPPRP